MRLYADYMGVSIYCATIFIELLEKMRLPRAAKGSLCNDRVGFCIHGMGLPRRLGRLSMTGLGLVFMV